MGLGPDSQIINTLFQNGFIKLKSFFFKSDTRSLVWEERKKAEKEHEGKCKLSSSQAWRCLLVGIQVVDPSDKKKLQEVKLDGFEYQFADGYNDNILIFDKSSDMLKMILDQLFWEGQDVCFLTFQSAFYVTVLCTSEFDFAKVKDLNIVFQDFTITLKSQDLFYKEGEYYKMKILVQLIEYDEKLITFGQSLLTPNFTVMFDANKRSMHFFGESVTAHPRSSFWLYFSLFLLLLLLVLMVIWLYQRSKNTEPSVSDPKYETLVQ